MNNDFINIPFDLKDRKLIFPKFSNIINKKIKLSDVVVCYNDGKSWKIIPLNILQIYPLIIDNYIKINKNNNDEMIQISIYVCPYTLFSCIYFGEFELYNKLYKTNLTIYEKNNKDSIIIPIFNKIFSLSTNDFINKIITRDQIKIMTLRNAISLFPDCQFIDKSEIKKKKKPMNYIQS